MNQSGRRDAGLLRSDIGKYR